MRDGPAPGGDAIDAAHRPWRHLRLVRGFTGVPAARAELRETWRSISLASVKTGAMSMQLPVILNGFARLRPGERMEFVHRFRRQDGSWPPGYSLVLRLAAPGDDASDTLATRIAEELRVGFACAEFDAPQMLSPVREPSDHAWHLRLRPLLACARLQAASLHKAHDPAQVHVLPFPRDFPNWAFTAALNERLELPATTEIVIRVHGIECTPAQCTRMNEIRSRLGSGGLVLFHPESPREPYAVAGELLAPTMAMLSRWLARPAEGYAIDCIVRASAPLGDAALARIGTDIFGDREASVSRLQADAEPVPPDFGSFARVEQGCPGVFPAVNLLPATGVPRHFDPPRVIPPSGGGAVVAQTVCGSRSTPVALADTERDKHVACFGGSGSGKSTLLLNLLAQGLAAPGAPGVALLDPHGSLVDDVLELVPRSRINDVRVVDVSAPWRSASLNPFDGAQDDPAYMQFIANEVVALVDVLFEGKDTTGPATRGHLKNLLLLASRVPGRAGTFLDAMRCLEDPDYGDHLAGRSGDRSLEAAWTRFRSSRGEQGFSAWQPYLMTRLAPFTGSPAMRRLINTPKRSVDIPQAMERGEILLFNISKAVLGDTESRIVGSLVLNQFFWAALARGTRARGRHKPMHLVIDEFQSFATDSVPRLFSEARKFGLCLATANQSIGQLRNQFGQPTVAQSVMANTATKIMFRLGSADSDLLGPYYAPWSEQDMVNLPDLHAVFRMPAGGSALPPFVARVERPKRDPAIHATAKEVCCRANRKCTRPTADVNEELARVFELPLASLETGARRKQKAVRKAEAVERAMGDVPHLSVPPSL